MEIDIESLRQAIVYELGLAMQEIPIAQAELIKAESTTDYEWLINEDTDEVLAEGPILRAEDVLWALGYRFTIEVDPTEEK